MEKIRLPRNVKSYIPLIVLLVAIAVLLPRSAKFNYDYHKGSPWMYETLVSQFDFPVLKTEEQMQAERDLLGAELIPYYRQSRDVVSEALEKARQIPLGSHEEMRPAVMGSIAAMYSKGIISQNVPGSTSSDELVYIQKDKRASKYPQSELYSQEDARNQLRNSLSEAYPDVNVDSLCLVAGFYDLLKPDLIYDQVTTELVHSESSRNISPTSGVVNAGTLIVSKGEIVTAEIQQVLDSYRDEYGRSMGYDGPAIMQWAGNLLFSLLVTLILLVVLSCVCPEIFADRKRYLYLLLVFFLPTLAVFILDSSSPGLFMLIPFALIVLYLAAFFDKNLVMPVYFVAMLPVLVYARNGVELYVISLFAGAAAMASFTRLNRGWLQFVSALIVFLAMALVWETFNLVDGERSNHRQLFMLALNSALIVAGYPIVYLFEKIFMLVSNSRLRDLCDTNNRLLRELADKAPGTFQHSLQVMNMSDAVARSIGANVLLVRTGALYHDIGKSLNPQCFIENQNHGNQYHEGLTPAESARDILRHVTDGLELAQKNNLPEEVRAFIGSHHGTTCTAYFYNKFLKEGGNPDAVSDFCYAGSVPTTREQVILMLCDSIEAASRTLKDYSRESVRTLVTGITRSKMDEKQFEDSEISLRDLNRIQDVLTDYLLQIYHARIVYPKRPAKSGR